MITLLQALTPRADVLAGELTEARFAAGLEEVVAGTAAEVYGDAGAFFASTYPSSALKTLLNEVLGRVGGGRSDGAAVVRLETNFGGGKTHNLIALFHAAQGRLSQEAAGEFMDPAMLPKEPVVQLGVFVGTTVGGSSFPTVNGIQASTPWGYLALQIGGVDAYEHIRHDDEQRSAPGAAALKRIFGDAPTIVLIDEIARYLSAAAAVAVADSTLAKQTVAFLMSLLEAADASPRAAVVVTTASTSDAFSDETAQMMKALEDAQSLLARKELVLRAADEADLPRILARRLFADDGRHHAATVAAAYADAADQAYARGVDLPEWMTGTRWASEVSRSYPFHPALIRVLDKRLATMPNFQRTRGALRLLARVVRRMWEEQTATELIHLHHVDLADAHLSQDLSSRIDRAAFEPVIRADVAGQPGGAASHAEAVDTRLGSDLARRLATTIYLYSLTADVPGVPTGEALGAVLAPGVDPALLQKALDVLEDACWYLHKDTRGLLFSTEPSLVKLIQDAEREISVLKARTEATRILGAQYKDGALKVRRAWEDAKVPDRSDDAWLVVLHWDDFGDTRGVDPHGKVPTKVTDLWEKTPTGGMRDFKNRIVLLAPIAANHDAMVRAVRRALALHALVGSGQLSALSVDKRADLARMDKEADLEARVAVCNHVAALYVPEAQGLSVVPLDSVSTASVRPNQTDAILDRLAAMEKTLTAGDKPLDPTYISGKLGTQFTTRQPTNELVRAFARRPDLKLVLDRAQLLGLVGAGVRVGVWEYQDPERGAEGWATQQRPGAAIRLAEDTYLHPVGSAPAPQAVACPLCGLVHSGACATGGGDDPGGGDDGPQPGGGVPWQFTTVGAGGPALAQARAQAADAGRHQLHQLTISVDQLGTGAAAEMRRLLSVVPAATLGAAIRYEVQMHVQLSNPTDTAEIRFGGPATDWAPLGQSLQAIVGTRQATLRAKVIAVFDPPEELSGEKTNRFLQAAKDTGPTTCTVILATEQTAP